MKLTVSRRFVAVVLVGLLACAAFASRSSLERLLPDNLLAGWNPVKQSTVYGSGEGLTAIYDGGYQTYTKAGVQEALRRIYSSKGLYAEITLHRMKSADAARKFLNDRYRMEHNKPAPRDPKFRRFVVSGQGSTSLYAVKGVWYYTVMAYDTSKRGRQAADALGDTLDKRLK